MNDDVLERLFYGEINPFEDSVRDQETFRSLNHELGELWSQVENTASPELLELLERYMASRADMDILFQLDRFKTGFELGIQFILAAIGIVQNGDKST